MGRMQVSTCFFVTPYFVDIDSYWLKFVKQYLQAIGKKYIYFNALFWDLGIITLKKKNYPISNQGRQLVTLISYPFLFLCYISIKNEIKC